MFVAAQTVTTDGAMSSWFAPGDNVVFRAYAVDPKSKKVVDPKAVKYFYVTIPNQPNVKLQVRRDRAGRIDRAAVDGHVDGTRQLSGRNRAASRS